MKKRNSIFTEILIATFLFSVVILSFLADISIVPIPEFITDKIINVEDLYITLFSIQASVSTISIAIVSIITSVLNDTVYGIAVSQYITSLKPHIFKHKIIIILNLCLIVVNYFCVSFVWFNCSIALFVSSILLNILLVKDIYVILLGKENVRNDILNYLLENYDDKHILKLTVETINAIETGSSIIIKNNYEAYKSIFEKELKKSNNNETAIIVQLYNSISDIFEKIVKEHDPRKTYDSILFICNIYDVANENKDHPFYLKLWNYISSNYFMGIKDLSFEQLQDDYVHIQLRYKLYDNIKGLSNDDINVCTVKYYSARIYSALFRSESSFSSSESEKIKKDIYIHASYAIENKKETNDSINKLYAEELCYLHKAIIDYGDCDYITNHYFKKLSYRNISTLSDTIFVVTLIYLYYLSSREKLISDKPLQMIAQKILDTNKSFINSFYYNIDFFELTKLYYHDICAFMRNWECMDFENAKYIVMDIVIQDFFIYTSLNKSWEGFDDNLLSSVVPIMIPKGIFSVYSRYFPNKEYKYIKKEYQQFNKLFLIELDDELLMKQILFAQDVFDKIYKDEVLSESRENAITEILLADLKEKSLNKVNSVIIKELTHFNFKPHDSETPVTKADKINRTAIFTDMVISPLWDKEQFENYLSNSIHSNIIAFFLNKIFKNLNFQKISFKERNKQATLINNFNSLHINGDILIGNRDRRWNEDDKSLLNDFTSKMINIEYPGINNYYFILDSNLIEFEFNNIRVEYSDLTWNEMLEYCHTDERGKISFNVTNELYIPFEKTELEEYMHNAKRKITIYADIKYRLRKSKVGAGIKIVLK